jgi:hypothetical protein
MYRGHMTQNARSVAEECVIIRSSALLQYPVLPVPLGSTNQNLAVNLQGNLDFSFVKLTQSNFHFYLENRSSAQTFVPAHLKKSFLAIKNTTYCMRRLHCSCPAAHRRHPIQSNQHAVLLDMVVPMFLH